MSEATRLGALGCGYPGQRHRNPVLASADGDQKSLGRGRVPAQEQVEGLAPGDAVRGTEEAGVPARRSRGRAAAVPMA